MEEIANNLAAIEQQKKQFAENYNQLSLKEAQLIQQLEAYKTHESFVVHVSVFLNNRTSALKIP
jgi:uncharacterized NAD(P)/FAD-binding protein YdhS